MNSAIANRFSLVLSFIGIFVAGVLSLAKLFNVSVPCGGSHGCDLVAASPASVLFGVVPIAYIGLAAYVFFAVCACARAYLGPTRLLVLLPLALSAFGAIVHVGLAMYSYASINATCWWCLASMITMVCLFIAHAAVAQTQGVFKRNEKLDLALILGLAVLASGALGFQGVQLRNGGAAPPYDAKALALMTPDILAPSGSHVYGDPDSPITVVEFADFFCPACHQYYPTVKKLVDERRGLVRLVYRHFPLMQMKGHELSWQAAVLSEYAAESGKFWQFADTLHAQGKEDLRSTDDLLGIVSQIGLNGEDADRRWADATDPAFKRAYEDYQLSNKLGLIMTPTFLIMAPGEPTQVASPSQVETYLSEPRYQRFKPHHASL